MKVLFIGGTGNISAASSRLCIDKGIDLYHLNRGMVKADIPGVKSIKADITDVAAVNAAMKDHEWDVVVNWIAFVPEDVQRDFSYFSGKTKQYIFISSASAYQKPLEHPFITESTPLKNPFWQYSRDKIACEDLLWKLYREEDFPMTIVRPSLTYDTVIPAAIGSWDDFTIIDRMMKGKEILVHGDGTSLWSVTHADDFAVGFVGLLGHQQAVGDHFHITTDEVLTWNQIYDAMAAAVGLEAKMVHVSSDFIVEAVGKIDWDYWLDADFMRGNLHGDKAVSTVFDNSKIKRFVPEFNAVIPFKQGIRRTVEWFMEKPERMKIVEENNRLIDEVIAAYRTQ